MNVWYRSNTLIWARHRLQPQKKLPMSTHSALENQMTSTHTLRAISIYSVPMVKVISKLVPRDSTSTPLATVTGPTMLSVSQILISKVDSLPQLSWFSLHTCQFYYHTIKKVKTKLLLESIWVTQSEYHSYYQGCFSMHRQFTNASKDFESTLSNQLVWITLLVSQAWMFTIRNSNDFFSTEIIVTEIPLLCPRTSSMLHAKKSSLHTFGALGSIRCSRRFQNTGLVVYRLRDLQSNFD